MTALQLELDQLICSPMGCLEFVVEYQNNGKSEKWFVVAPHQGFTPNYYASDLPLSRGCRLVVDAHSLRPVGVFTRSEFASAGSANDAER